MKTFYIKSEHPADHWGFLPVQDAIVLDLGCGCHLTERGWPTTPEFFKQHGAKTIIGIDPCEPDIVWYNLTIPDSLFYIDKIDSINKIEQYIERYKPTVMKMDIEWNEKYFIQSASRFESLKYVAIETHSRELFHDMLFKLVNIGFNIDCICTFYPRVYDICNVIYASRD